MDDPRQPAHIASASVFRGPLFGVRRDIVRLPDGREVRRDVVEHPGAVVVVPLLPGGRVVLVRQHRHAVNEWLLEFPAGTLEPGEAPAVTAARELREEVGLRAGRLTPLGSFYSAPGFCSELLHCFLAEDLAPDPLDADDDEQIEVVSMPLGEALALARSGGIRDAKTLAALLLVQGTPAGQPDAPPPASPAPAT